jgi:hypothetical protein
LAETLAPLLLGIDLPYVIILKCFD